MNITIVDAELKDDSDVFSKMDPFVTLLLPGDTVAKQTKAHQNAGMAPVWNETFTFPVMDVKALSGVVTYKVMEEDSKNHHDELGGDSILLGLLYNGGQGLTAKLPLFNQKEGK